MFHLCVRRASACRNKLGIFLNIDILAVYFAENDPHTSPVEVRYKLCRFVHIRSIPHLWRRRSNNSCGSRDFCKLHIFKEPRIQLGPDDDTGKYFDQRDRYVNDVRRLEVISLDRRRRTAVQQDSALDHASRRSGPFAIPCVIDVCSDIPLVERRNEPVANMEEILLLELDDSHSRGGVSRNNFQGH